MLRCDNGPELACEAMADWAGERVGLSFIPPGEPWRNGYVESFNSRVRDECLNINIFWSLAQARVVISDWKDESRYAGDLVPGQWDREGRVTASIGDRAWASSRCWFVPLDWVAVS